jgi:Tol biopolymer transport system component
MALYLFFLLTSFLAAAETGRAPAAPDPRVPRLAAEVHNKGWIVFSAKTPNGDWDLFLMRPDGSKLRNISNTPGSSEMGARFSPDGRKMLYRLIAKSSTIPHDRWGALGKLVIANADGTNPVTWGQDGEFPWASWSPDGKQLACLNKTGIEIVAVDSKAVVRKMDRKGIYQQFFWSPDGKWFTGPANSYGENWTVVRMDANSQEVNAVSKFQNCTPDWFPDSKRLIFSSRPASQPDDELAKAVGQKPGYGWTQLWMANGDGTGKSLVYGEDGRHIYGGAISPDGHYVLFTRGLRDGLSGDQNGGVMGLMRMRDAPTIAGASTALRKLHPHTKDGPVLTLPMGWEPHWTYAAIPSLK